MKLKDIKHLHDIGWSLLYLRERDKRPVQDGWTTRPNKSWKDLEREFNLSYNIGVRLGEHSKIGDGYLCCIDVDIKDPKYAKEALANLKEVTNGQEESFPTVLSGSGNGSRHLYCTSKERFGSVTIEKHKGRWEICAYSDGRQMVLAPSTHPNGSRYRWLIPLLDASDLPALPNLERYKERETAHKENRLVGVEGERKEDFKAEAKVLLDRLSDDIREMIVSGEGVTDRSAALMTVAMSMCRNKYTDNQILTVLSDSSYFLAKCAYDHTNSQSRSVAVKWLRKHTLEKARYETHPMRDFERLPSHCELRGSDDTGSHVEGGSQSSDWEIMDRISTDIADDLDADIPDRTKEGKPKNTLKNVLHILDKWMRKEVGGPLLGHDDFACRAYFLKDAPFGAKAGDEVIDKHDLDLQVYIANRYKFEPPKSVCFDAIQWVAYQNAYHPVRDYLKRLKWDGVKRLDNWLTSTFGAPNTEIARAFARKILVAAITRVFEPGCKFDHILVLEGAQDMGKSRCLALLAGAQAHFTDNLGDVANKDVVDQMAGKWIVEMSELAGLSKADNNLRKSFITRQVDRVRKSYGKRSQDYPRQCVFFGSTNDDQYLNDPTGNRRYWPVQALKADAKWVKANRDQLWAEAYQAYLAKEAIYLESTELKQLAYAEQDKRYETDEWEFEVKKMLAETDETFFRLTEIWRCITGNIGEDAHPNMQDAKRLSSILIRLKMKKMKTRIDGVQAKVWAKP